jgi:hypothetical protein
VNADLSVAPEIAQLAAPLALVPSPLGPSAQGRAPAAHAPSARLTTGQLATELSRLAAAPERWWDLVQFNPDRPARIAVPASFEAWLLVIPPGQAAECRCVLGTQIAGDAVEVPRGGAAPGRGVVAGGVARQLRQGRVAVHAPGNQHVMRSAGHGYSVTLHAGERG